MAMTPFDEEAVRRALDAIAAASFGAPAAGQSLELLEWIATDPTPRGENLHNLLGAFLTIGSRLAAMTAGAEEHGDIGRVLKDVDDAIVAMRERYERGRFGG